MKPQEKAKELFSKMYQSPFVKKADAKRCALIAVEEIMRENRENEVQDRIVYTIGTFLTADQYWQQVKEEIEKL